MAAFIVNSTADKAVRLSAIKYLAILPVYAQGQGQGGTLTGYKLSVRVDDVQGQEIVFETGATQADVAALAAPVLAALG